MATQLKLDPETERLIDDLMASGRFAARADVLRHGIRLAHDEDHPAAPLSKEEVAGIERGLADVAAGRLIPSSEVRAEMRHRFATGA